jgi:hypothetical protein
MELSPVSPCSNTGASVPTIGRSAIVLLIAIQIVAAAMNGYLAGRLRTKWATFHSDDVYIRDTANDLRFWQMRGPGAD